MTPSSDFSQKLKALGFASYDDYLRSDHWQSFRKKFFRSKKPKHCACCRVPNFTVELHHKTYIRLGCERLTDVVPLCREHHEQVHELLKIRYGGAVEWSGVVISRISLRSRKNGRWGKSLHTPDNIKGRDNKPDSDDFTDTW